MRTKREIVTDALREIRVTPIFDTPSGNDYVHVAGMYDEMHATLVDEGLAYWPNTNDDTEEIPLQVSSALVSLLAGWISKSYGKEEGTEQDNDGRVVSASVMAKRTIRRHISKRPSGEATEFSSY